MTELDTLIGRLETSKSSRATASEGRPSKLFGRFGEEAGPTLSSAQMEAILEAHLSEDQRGILGRTGKMYFPYTCESGRYDVHVTREGSAVALSVTALSKTWDKVTANGARLFGLLIFTIGFVWTGLMLWFAFKTGWYFPALLFIGPYVLFLGLPPLILGQTWPVGPNAFKETTVAQKICFVLGLVAAAGTVWLVNGGWSL